MIEWLRNNRASLSITGIEIQMNKMYGMPVTTLWKAIGGSQTLPKKWEDPLNEFIAKLKA